MSNALLPLAQQREILGAMLLKSRHLLWPHVRPFTFPTPNGKIVLSVRLTEKEEQQFLAGTLPRSKVKRWLAGERTGPIG